MTGFLQVTGADLACVAPELVLALFASLILLLDAFARPLRTFFPYVTLLSLALANLAGRDSTGTFFGGAVESSGLSRYIELVALGAVALAVLGGAAALERDRRNQGEF
jgi:NADH:ubiquinone oxidoreductase subunit 2 (subunit N)